MFWGFLVGYLRRAWTLVEAGAHDIYKIENILALSDGNA
jgi:hypothetical protein